MANLPLRNHPRSPAAAWLVIATVIVGAFEGLYTHPYYDSVGVRTVCYGATAADKVDLHRSYTPDECKDMLARDLPKYDVQVQHCISPAAYDALTPNRHAAIVSFTYNLGEGALCRSSVARDLNAGEIIQACNDLLRYDRAKGRVLKGLTTRRIAERKLCLRDD